MQAGLNILFQRSVRKIKFFLICPNEKCQFEGLWERGLKLNFFSLVLLGFSALVSARLIIFSGFCSLAAAVLWERGKVAEADLLTTYAQYVLPKASS